MSTATLLDLPSCPGIRRYLAEKHCNEFADWLRIRRVPSIHPKGE